jgi:arginine:agmatine antiporter
MAEDGNGHPRVGLAGATALVAGTMIGSGVFLLPATLGAIGSISLLGWAAATAAALAIAGVFAWLGPLVPQARGLAGYVQAGLGRGFGVQTGVAYWSLGWVSAVAIALAVAGYLSFLVPELGGGQARLALTLALVWLAVGACWAGPRFVARIEGLTLALGLLPVLLAATIGWLWFRPELFVRSWNPQELGLAAAVAGSALPAFWAFLGVEAAAAAAGVVRRPERNVGRATLLGVAAAAALYIAASAALMGLLPSEALARSSAPFADAAPAALGAGVAVVVAACAALRAAGGLTASILVAAETSRGAADEAAFPAAFRTRPGERASAVNLLAAGGLASLVALSTAAPTLGEQFGTLANVATILSLYCYALAGLSLIRLRGALAGGRRTAALLTGAAAIGCSIALIATGKPLELGLSLVPIAAAAAFHLLTRRGSSP